MSPNPAEQFPNNDINTKGAHAGNPNVPEDVRETPTVEYSRPLDQAAKNDITVPDTYEEGFQYAPLSDEEIAAAQARLNPEKKKISLGVKIGVAAASLLALAGIAKGVSDGATGGGFIDKDKLANPLPTATAPVVPGAVAPTEVAPTPEASVTYTIVNANNVENYIKDYDAFADSIKVPHSEYEDEGKAFLGIVKQINNLLNVELTEEEIAASETLKTEDGKVGPEALAAMKRDAYNELLPDAAFKGQLDKISESNFKYWMQTRNDPNPFKTEFVRTGTEINVFKYINNAGQGNSLKPIANADIFRFYAVDPTLAGSKLGESSSTDEKTYTLNPGTKLVKEGSTANQR